MKRGNGTSKRLGFFDEPIAGAILGERLQPGEQNIEPRERRGRSFGHTGPTIAQLLARVSLSPGRVPTWRGREPDAEGDERSSASQTP